MQGFIIGDDEPIVEAVTKSKVAMGDVAWEAIRTHLVPFLQTVRDIGLPIIHTRVIPERYDDPNHEDLRIVDPMQPASGETVIEKPYPSAFYGTDLLTRLIRSGADTLILIGNTTSGCIRATAVDAQQYGFKLVVPEDCVFDRIEASHKIGLLDLWMKYAEVLPRDEVEHELRDRYGATTEPPNSRDQTESDRASSHDLDAAE
jgi:nicotinamidase-related amidase